MTEWCTSCIFSGKKNAVFFKQNNFNSTKSFSKNVQAPLFIQGSWEQVSSSDLWLLSFQTGKTKRNSLKWKREKDKHIVKNSQRRLEGASWSPDLGVIGFVRGWSARLQHLLHQVEAHARLALVLGHGEVIKQVEMSHVGAVRVPVLVHKPLPLAGVRVPRADVLGLQMLQLTVDVVPVRHPGPD